VTGRPRRIALRALSGLLIAAAAFGAPDPNPPPPEQPAEKAPPQSPPSTPAESQDGPPAQETPRGILPPTASNIAKLLPGRGQVSGTVLTPNRQPVKGASVGLILQGGQEVYGTSTGEDGRYSLKGLRTGVYSVLVMDPGGSILRKERVNARPLFRNIVDFQTAPAGTAGPHVPSFEVPTQAGEPVNFDMTGLLKTAEGETIPEAWIVVAPLGAEAPSLRARTDAEGRFRLLRIQVGYYRITVKSLGHITWSLGPILYAEPGEVYLELTLTAFHLGQPQSVDDLLVPVEPFPPESFDRESS
jgi:hypothetical protein